MRAALDGFATPASGRNLRALLARREFRWLFGARLGSQLGDGWFQAGLASSVIFNPERAPTPGGIAVAFAVLFLPYSLLGPFVGVFLDRWSRRNSLALVNWLRAGLVLPAAAFVWAGSENLAFIVTALTVVACNRFFLAGTYAALPHAVDAPRLVTANSIVTTAGTLTYSFGLATAAGVFGFVGAGLRQYAVATAAATICYFASASILRLRFGRFALGPEHAQPTPVLQAVGQTVRGLMGGLRHLAERRPAWSVMVVQAMHRGCYGVLMITILLLYRSYFTIDNPGKSLVGLLGIAGAGGAGALLAALVTPSMARRLGSAGWLTGLTAAAAVLVPAFGLPYLPALAVVGTFAISVASQGTKILTDAVLQQQVDDRYRGRVFSVNDTVYNLLFVGGVSVGALVLPPDGHEPPVMIATGVAYALVALWYGINRTRHQPSSAA